MEKINGTKMLSEELSATIRALSSLVERWEGQGSEIEQGLAVVMHEVLHREDSRVADVREQLDALYERIGYAKVAAVRCTMLVDGIVADVRKARDARDKQRFTIV